MAHDNGIIISGGNPGAEFLPVPLLKVPLGCHQDVGGGVQPQKLRGPLFNQVIRNHKQALLAEAQPLALHGGGNHLKGFARADLMGQQGIPAVHLAGNGV